MDPLLERIAAFASRHSMFSAGRRIGVAVSGGADSVFLLHALHELAPRWNLHLSVVHIDHGIRGAESLADASFVSSLTKQFALSLHLRTTDLGNVSENLEQAARQFRHDVYLDLVHSGAVDRIATGHSRSDQAETVLYRLLRGAGLTGLRGVLPSTAEGLVRPLLPLTRTEIEDWLRSRSISWREDSTNRDLSYARNRIRHETLPMLRAAFNPRLDEALANLATLACDEEAYWDEVLPHPNRQGDVILLDTQKLTASPAAGRRLLRRAITAVKGDLRQIEFAHIERVMDMASSAEGHDRAILPGVDVLRSFTWLRIAPVGYGSNRPRDFETSIQVPGVSELPELTTRVTFRLGAVEDQVQACDTVENKLDWLRLQSQSSSQGGPPALELRNWRPGDQYRRLGESHEEKLKLLFQQYRIPLWERRTWPVVTCNGRIVWTRRFGPAAEVAASANTLLPLWICEERTNRC